QAGDGIRGFHVTGVQTCALPILAALCASLLCPRFPLSDSALFYSSCRFGGVEIVHAAPIYARYVGLSTATNPCKINAQILYARSEHESIRDTRHFRNPGLPGGGQATVALDDPLALQQPRDLPARAGVERIRRLRQAEIGRARCR